MSDRVMDVSGADYLMDVLERLGYSTGNVYSGKVFIEDLVHELQCDVKATFEDHPDDISSRLKRLREVTIFTDREPQIPIAGLSFEEHIPFVFEDIHVRCIVSINSVDVI